MNNKKIIAVITSVIIIAICMISSGYKMKYFLSEMIYENINSMNSELIFSKKSGFYAKDFKVKIYAPSEEIYYTLDGSEPTKNSYKYESPILIKDATLNENVYSSRTDVCGSFLTENSMYVVPDYLVDKCTILKAAYYDKEGNRSTTETRTYFVNFEEKEGYSDINIISVTTDPKNLFDDQEGIYVLGNTFEEYCTDNDLSEENFYRWDANFLNRGKEWEREANIQVFNTNKEIVLNQNLGIRIQGGISRGFLPKSLNFYARDEYGDNRIRYDFWGTGYYPQRMTLSAGGNDFYGKMLDRLGAESTRNLDFCTLNYAPYVLFLNGEYWGFYYLTEKYDEHYIEHYYGVDSSNVAIIKDKDLEVGTEDDHEDYEIAKTFIERFDMSDESKYQMACMMMDMDSLIDYFAAEIYMARNVDWPSANFALWRAREKSDRPYEDGKWRWMLYDVNTSAFSAELLDHDTVEYALRKSEMFASLYENESFKEAFWKRIFELADTNFQPSAVEEKIRAYEKLMSAPMENHHRRFFATDNSSYHSKAASMIEFAKNRKSYMEKLMKLYGVEIRNEVE